MNLGLVPCFLCRFDRRDCFANVAPGLIELAKLPISRAKRDRYTGKKIIVPIERQTGIAEAKMPTAFEVLPVRAKTLARLSIPLVFQEIEPFSSASTMSSSDCACAIA